MIYMGPCARFYARHHVGYGRGCIRIVAGEHLQQAEHLHLHEGVGYRTHVALRLLAGRNCLQSLGETWNQLSEARNIVGNQ